MGLIEKIGSTLTKLEVLQIRSLFDNTHQQGDITDTQTQRKQGKDEKKKETSV